MTYYSILIIITTTILQKLLATEFLISPWLQASVENYFTNFCVNGYDETW